MFRFLVLLFASVIAFAFTANAKVDLSGKSITWVVPFKEGGGTSRFSRFIQPFLTKYLQVLKICLSKPPAILSRLVQIKPIELISFFDFIS